MRKITFFAFAAQGKGISGGDRIFMELTRRWSKNNSVKIFLWKEGKQMCHRNNLKENRNLTFVIMRVPSIFGDILNYVYRVFYSVRFSFYEKYNSGDIVVASSDLWMDFFPALLSKILFPKIVFVASWYQTAPNPLKGFTEGSPRSNSYRLSSLRYFLMQLPVKVLIKTFADYVIVNNQDEIKNFKSLHNRKKVIVLIGAIDSEKIGEYRKHNNKKVLKYDAVFQGRFHPQKGVEELVEVWKLVVDSLPDAKLIMIGDGPLMDKVKAKIKEYNLNKNIFLEGFVFDGAKKYSIFNSSKLVVHPSFYDSGGMASAEAMAFDIPCVAFDLKAYKSYYPNLLKTVKTGDLRAFSTSVVNLLKDNKVRNLLGNRVGEYIIKNYSWDKRASEILSKIH